MFTKAQLFVVACGMMAWCIRDAERYGGPDEFMFRMPMDRLLFMAATISGALWLLNFAALLPTP